LINLDFITKLLWFNNVYEDKDEIGNSPVLHNEQQSCINEIIFN